MQVERGGEERKIGFQRGTEYGKSFELPSEMEIASPDLVLAKTSVEMVLMTLVSKKIQIVPLLNRTVHLSYNIEWISPQSHGGDAEELVMLEVRRQ